MARSLGRSTVRYSDRYSVPTTVSRILAPTDADKRHRDTETPRRKENMAEIAWHRHLGCTRVRDDAMRGVR